MPLRRVDPEVAREIAQWFLRAPNYSRGRITIAAYRELQIQTDHQFAQLTTPQGRFGYTVVWTREKAPYATATEMIAAVRATRLLEVTAARAERGRPHPALDCGVGGGYDRMRAVHDLVGHVMTGYGFDRDSEYSAWRRQSGLYSGIARWAAATELHAEHSVVWTTRQFPEHKAVLLPRYLLRRSGNPRSDAASR